MSTPPCALGDLHLLSSPPSYSLALPHYTAALAQTGGGPLYGGPPRPYLLHRRALCLHRTGSHRRALQDLRLCLSEGAVAELAASARALIAEALFEEGEFEACIAAAGEAAGLAEEGGKRRMKLLRRKCEAEIEEEAGEGEAGEGEPAVPPATAAAAPPAAAPPAAAPPAAALAAPKRTAAPKIPKYAYYQSDSFMTVSVSVADLCEGDVRCEFGGNHAECVLRVGGEELTVFAGVVWDDIVPEGCRLVVKKEEVRVKMKKGKKCEWHELFAKKKGEVNSERKGGGTVVLGGYVPLEREASPADGAGAPRPYASKKDWNAVDRELTKAEESEKPEGEEALNHLFKNIYGDASDETRRAMVKSFQTSGGTVLSTNWDEVSKKDYEKERQAPKGMQWKNWDGDKLAQKED
ncbi:hypothetical protein TeGR_g11928 [Tetraparma gracilis]|uniref:SGS domain-containing protein n=1 Tax=Tetraparma gracilis TaxID=2962635 RepID=A0ABQ6NF41_9STRA|nr:hypothetical protein TeGR_g11928 [Tetraparma gracilis]